jgi:Tfp pilus assembly protein PilX
MVSILVTMLLMVVITLIVLGFAQISRRNQRQAVDRQLSTQAFYAAEAGINDARNLIKNAISSGTAIPAKTDCTNGSGPAAAFYGGLNASLDTPNNVSYTCLMVDPAPKTLLYNDIGTSSTIIPLVSASGVNLSSLKLSILSKDGTPNPVTGCPSTANAAFSTTAAWTASGCGYGVLRFDLVPTNGALTMNGLQTNTMTSFLVPVSSGTTSIPFPASPATSNNPNNRVAMTCLANGCNMTITGLSTNQYYMRITSIYKDVTLVVAANDSSSNPLALTSAQAVIDATGKAQDVLRRVQVHIPLTPSSSNQLSDYAIESTDAICKRFVTMDGYFQSYAASSVAGLTSITTPPNPLCQ